MYLDDIKGAQFTKNITESNLRQHRYKTTILLKLYLKKKNIKLNSLLLFRSYYRIFPAENPTITPSEKSGMKSEITNSLCQQIRGP